MPSSAPGKARRLIPAALRDPVRDEPPPAPPPDNPHCGLTNRQRRIVAQMRAVERQRRAAGITDTFYLSPANGEEDDYEAIEQAKRTNLALRRALDNIEL